MKTANFHCDFHLYIIIMYYSENKKQHLAVFDTETTERCYVRTLYKINIKKSTPF